MKSRRRGDVETCRGIIDLLSDYLDGGLALPARAGFESHMADCPECVEFLESVRGTCDRARSLRCEEIPPAVRAAFRSFLGRSRGRRS
jgi:anti-sigma factor RsiW